jgi:hypothetical protein
MIHQLKYKRIIGVSFGVILIVLLAYLAIFGRALSQRENHLGILLALPKVILSSEAVRIDNETYLTRDAASFIEIMEQQGFTHIEQLGAAHFFQKDGNRYISTSRMYSAHFMVFTYPVLY